ncbi:MAG TPA: VanZ family protein [Flavisolibacter sp.]|nr:VanZ family protein [Flavisolibacter sp.]
MLTIITKYAKPLAIAWLLVISVLFFLPGSALPKETWLNDIQFDKWVHFGFFALLLFLWRFFLPAAKKYSWFLLLGALFYGLGVELVQHYLIANRSFDMGDVAADMAGAVAGILFWQGYIKK